MHNVRMSRTGRHLDGPPTRGVHIGPCYNESINNVNVSVLTRQSYQLVIVDVYVGPRSEEEVDVLGPSAPTRGLQCTIDARSVGGALGAYVVVKPLA